MPTGGKTSRIGSSLFLSFSISPNLQPHISLVLHLFAAEHTSSASTDYSLPLHSR